MSNKSQILCSLDNSLKVENLKTQRNLIKQNQETIKTLKEELNQLERNNPISMPIQDPYHPNYSRYISTTKLIEEFEELIKVNSKWIKIISESITESTC